MAYMRVIYGAFMGILPFTGILQVIYGTAILEQYHNSLPGKANGIPMIGHDLWAYLMELKAISN